MSKPWSPILAEHRLYHTHPCVGTGVVRCSDNTCCRLQEPLCQTLKKRQYKSDKSLPYLLISKYLLSPGYFQRSMWQTAIMSTCSLITPFGDIFKDGLHLNKFFYLLSVSERMLIRHLSISIPFTALSLMPCKIWFNSAKYDQ